MPIYEYECQKCKAHVEILQKITDKPLAKCRKCGGKLEKRWSVAGFQFKGTGWYVTDYAGKKAAAEEKKSGASEPSSSSTGSADNGDGAKADGAKAADAPVGKKSAPKTSSSKNSSPSKNRSGD